MNWLLIVKAGFIGFSISVGVMMLVFYVAGFLMKVTQRHFLTLFAIGVVSSLVALYGVVQLRAPNYEGLDLSLFSAGSLGGWIGGIMSSLTSLRRILINMNQR